MMFDAVEQAAFRVGEAMIGSTFQVKDRSDGGTFTVKSVSGARPIPAGHVDVEARNAVVLVGVLECSSGRYDNATVWSHKLGEQA